LQILLGSLIRAFMSTARVYLHTRSCTRPCLRPCMWPCDSIFKAIILIKILYALPVHYGYLTEGQRHMFQRVLHRASSRGFTPFYYDLNTLAENAHYHLFKHSCRQAHCLNHLYSVKTRPPGAMRLRTHGHDFELPILSRL